MLELQDSKALRLALAARPRVSHAYQPGMYVAFWRSQKWVHGTLEKTGRWCGPAVVLGYVGQNIVLIHKRQIFRCAPQQVRSSTESELKLVETPHMDLLGIKHLIESNSLESRQYIDLVPESYPGDSQMPEEAVARPTEAAEPRSIWEQAEREIEPSATASSSAPNRMPHHTPSVPEEKTIDEPDTEEKLRDLKSKSVPYPSREVQEPEASAYGPLRQPRRRIHQKDHASALYRPGRMTQSDFQDMMQEIVPELLNNMLEEKSPIGTPSAEQGQPNPDSRGVKRPSEPSADSSEPAAKRTETGSGDTFAMDEITVCSVEVIRNCGLTDHLEDLSSADRRELADRFLNGDPIEQLVASYMKKKSSKELAVTGNPPELQKKIDEAKALEWCTIQGKHAGRLVLGPEADLVREKFPHRIMGSRFVVTIKQEEDAPPRTKARWCLLGHLDPDLTDKAQLGDLQSPTGEVHVVPTHCLSQMAIGLRRHQGCFPCCRRPATEI